jgi:hypothetical protein
MADVQISQLPEYTGNTNGSWIIMNNSGQTTTYKVSKETFVGTLGTNNKLTKFTSSTTIGDATNLSDDGTTFKIVEDTIITGSLSVTGSNTIVGDLNINNTSTNFRKLSFINSSGTLGAFISFGTAGVLSISTTSTGSKQLLLGRVDGQNFLYGNTYLSGSLDVWNGNVTVTGSLKVMGSISQTGSLKSNVSPLSISTNTASLDLSQANYFTLQLVSGSSTHLNPTNIQPGQTVSVFVNTVGSATMTFPSSIKQISGSAYVPTSETGLDILTLISQDTNNLYLVSAKNMI